MKFSVYLFVLLLTISHFTVHSVPIRHMVEEHQSVKVIRRKTNLDTKKTDDSILKANEFAHELANASLSNYLKDLYVNFSFFSGPTNPLKDQKIIAANTIRSYENQVNSKLSACIL